MLSTGLKDTRVRSTDTMQMMDHVTLDEVILKFWQSKLRLGNLLT